MSRLQTRTLLAVVLLLAAFGLIGLNATGTLNFAKSPALWPLAAVQTWVSRQYTAIYNFITSPRDLQALQERNAELEQQVAQLQLQLVQQQEQQAELAILSGLLNYARENPTGRYVTADVIGRDTSPFLKYILLNRGSDAGLTRDMPVVTNEGLVGRVAEVTATASKVQLIVDPDMAVTVRVQSSRAEGVLVGELGGDLSLQFLSQDAKLEAGDLVLTSGLGGTFPADLLVGRVENVRKRDQDVFQQATVRSAIDFKRLEIVLIITNFTPPDLTPFQATPAAP